MCVFQAVTTQGATASDSQPWCLHIFAAVATNIAETRFHGSTVQTVFIATEWWFLFLLIWLDVRTASANPSATLPPCKTLLPREKLLTWASASFREHMLTKIWLFFLPRPHVLLPRNLPQHIYLLRRVLKKKQLCGEYVRHVWHTQALPRRFRELPRSFREKHLDFLPKLFKTIASSDIFVLWAILTAYNYNPKPS